MLLNKTQSKNPLLQTVEYRHFGFIRILSVGVFVGEVLIAIGIIWFLYAKTYLAVDKLQTVVLLQEYANTQTIPFNTLDKLEEMWDKRHTTTLPEIKRNPFITQ